MIAVADGIRGKPRVLRIISVVLRDTPARVFEATRSPSQKGAGHRRDGAVIRTVGEDHEPRQFSAWAPVALAAIGHLPGTIEDRSIRIGLRRRRPDEAVEPLRLDRADHLDELVRKAARWAADHAAKLAAADPAMPAGASTVPRTTGARC